MTTNNSIDANSTTPLSTTNGGTGVSAPTAHGVLIGEGASAIHPIVLTAGQVLIGTTASDPVGATLTAGTNVTITSVSGSITINASGGTSFTWNDVTGTTQTAAVNNVYTASNAGVVTITLPTTAAYGTTIEVGTGSTAGGWVVAQNASQNIILGNTTSTTGTGGSLASTLQGDMVELLCIVADTTWQVRNCVGNLTVT